MKKLITLVIATACMLSMGGCQKTISGADVFSFPEPTIQVKGTFYSQGVANEFVIGSETYNPDDMSVMPFIEWFYSLELKECEEPEAVEGSETYSFAVGNESVSYDDRGNTAFIVVGDKWFEVQNPTAPPIDFDSLTPSNGSEQTFDMSNDFLNAIPAEVNDNIIQNCISYSENLGYKTGEMKKTVLLGEDCVSYVYCEDDMKQELIDSGDIVVIFENIRCVVDAETEIVLGRIPFV